MAHVKETGAESSCFQLTSKSKEKRVTGTYWMSIMGQRRWKHLICELIKALSDMCTCSCFADKEPEYQGLETLSGHTGEQWWSVVMKSGLLDSKVLVFSTSSHYHFLVIGKLYLP